MRKRPDRFAALAAVAPQDPQAAAKELERSVSRLRLKGAVINSHTLGEFLDDRRFWPIFEAAAALDVPIYLHPNTPPKDMIGPLLERGLDGAIYGFAVECGMHLLALITSGVFDSLRISLGRPTTSARIGGVGSRSTSALSSCAMNRTVVRSSAGSRPPTTNHNAIASSSDDALSARFSEKAERSHFRSGIVAAICQAGR